MFVKPDTDRHDPDGERTALRRELLTIASGQVRTAVAGNAVVAAFSVAVLWDTLPHGMMAGWFGLIVVIGLIRLRAAAWTIATAPSADGAMMARQRRALILSLGFNGLLWGLFGSVLAGSDQMEARSFTGCVMMGMAAAAIASQAALPAAGRLFIMATLLPPALAYAVTARGGMDIGLAILCLFYCVMLLTFLRGSSASLTGAISARLHNEQLKAELEESFARQSDATAAARAASVSKSRFLANMSHEIRTPMNAVLGLATTLLDDNIPRSQRETVGAIRDSAESLLRLINEILDFSQIEAGRVTLETAPFSPRQLAHDVVSMLGSRASGKNLDLKLVLDDALPEWLLGDGGRIRQVLLNLAANAVKFTEHGGVTIEVACLSATGAAVETEWRVRDTGIGIAPEALATLFHDFTQADESIARRYGGSGLGLAISRRLVEMMDGKIDARSRPKAGSVFSFRLTARVAAAPAAVSGGGTSAEDALRGAMRGLGRRLSVLLVEDHPINQMVAKQMLRGFNLDLDIAHNGLEAVDAAARKTYDLILMDMRMPEMDGPEATRVIRRREAPGARVPIIALTANAFEEDVRTCEEAGMDGFISKPIRKQVFITTVLKVLTGPASRAAVTASVSAG